MAQPEVVFRHGCCSAAVFSNERVHAGQAYTAKSVTFQKNYKDDKGQWRTSSVLGVNDIPKAVLVLNKAYDYLTSGSEQTNAAKPSRGKSPSRPSNKRTRAASALYDPDGDDEDMPF